MIPQAHRARVGLLWVLAISMPVLLVTCRHKATPHPIYSTIHSVDFYVGSTPMVEFSHHTEPVTYDGIYPGVDGQRVTIVNYGPASVMFKQHCPDEKGVAIKWTDCYSLVLGGGVAAGAIYDGINRTWRFRNTIPKYAGASFANSTLTYDGTAWSGSFVEPSNALRTDEGDVIFNLVGNKTQPPHVGSYR